MKLNNLFKMPRAFRSLLIAVFALLSVGSLKAQNFFDNTISGINLGNASGGATGTHKNWAIFALSGGVTVTDPSVDGNYDVYGNVGIVGAGALSMSLSKITGSVYRDSGTFTGTGATITGTNTTGNGTYLNQGYNDITTAGTGASAVAASLATTTGPSTIALNNVPMSISATGSVTVLNLQDLILSGASAVLTLNGLSTQNYVINVSRYMTLSSAASIVLAGGLKQNNVLFNVLSNNPQYDVTLSGGSVVNGILMAATRNVKETGASIVYGEVIAKSVSLSGRSKVINPFVSP